MTQTTSLGTTDDNLGATESILGTTEDSLGTTKIASLGTTQKTSTGATERKEISQEVSFSFYTKKIYIWLKLFTTLDSIIAKGKIILDFNGLVR